MLFKSKHIRYFSGRTSLEVSFLIIFMCWNIVGKSQDVKISQLSVAKSTENAFGAFVYENTMYYCIDRGEKSTKKNGNQSGGVFLDLFQIALKQKNKTMGDPIRVSDMLNSKLNEGPLQISKDGKFLFYSKNLNSYKDTTAENKLGIYISQSMDNGWGVPEPFPFNSELHNLAHPTINNLGDMLIFSSDMDGGLGGTDLYVSYKKEGSWTSPANLGENLNTKWGESFPYLANNSLYFASTREGGIGGSDLYKSKFIDGKWQKPTLLEKPINTEYDDFCYFLNSDGKSGYISSNRNGTDGIFYFEKKIPEVDYYHQQVIQFCYIVTDSLMEESEDLDFTWDMGDDTKLKGITVEHCYQDTGVFTTQFSVYEKSTDRTYFPASDVEIIIDSKGFPVIEYEINDSQYEFSINNKWVTIDYDSYYWEIGDEKKFTVSPKVPIDKIDKIKLVIWNKKKDISVHGIELILDN